jgi:hypothetical protein
VVPGAGIEPAQHCCRGILSPLCLPIPPPGHRMLANAKRSRDLEDGGVTRSRTGLDGFAIHLKWSGKGDSNSRPQPWQGYALPTELFPQNT